MSEGPRSCGPLGIGLILFGVHVGPVLTIVMIGTSFFFSEDLLDRVASYPITRCHIIMG